MAGAPTQTAPGLVLRASPSGFRADGLVGFTV